MIKIAACERSNVKMRLGEAWNSWKSIWVLRCVPGAPQTSHLMRTGIPPFSRANPTSSVFTSRTRENICTLSSPHFGFFLDLTPYCGVHPLSSNETLSNCSTMSYTDRWSSRLLRGSSTNERNLTQNTLCIWPISPRHKIAREALQPPLQDPLGSTKELSPPPAKWSRRLSLSTTAYYSDYIFNHSPDSPWWKNRWAFFCGQTIRRTIFDRGTMFGQV